MKSLADSGGYVYLLHFERPISPKHTTQHYLGWAANLPARVQAHRRGSGARLTAVARERGIGFQVARLWRGGRELERRLKGRKNAPQFCPCCGGGLACADLLIDDVEAALLPF